MSWVHLLHAASAGISPVTRDYVSPEKPWPHLKQLAAATAASGKALLPRLPVYPAYLQQQQVMVAANRRRGTQLPQQQQDQQPEQQQEQQQRPQMWLDATGGRASAAAAVFRLADGEGLARGSTWFAGAAESAPGEPQASPSSSTGSGLHADQQTAAPPAAVQQQQDQQQGGLKSSTPTVRRRSPARGWRVAVGEDGLLEGCPGPQRASREVRRLLASVLEQQHELSEGEIELLFSGKPRGWRRAGVRQECKVASCAVTCGQCSLTNCCCSYALPDWLPACSPGSRV